MNVKVQCQCGARYSFDVEPVDGRMPFPVKCPNCGADGVEAANQIIAQPAGVAQSAPPAEPAEVAAPPPPRVRVASAEAPAAPRSPTGESFQTAQAVKAMLAQRKAREEKSFRTGMMIVGLLAAAAVVTAGFWGWYVFAGSKPGMTYAVPFGSGDDTTVEFVGPNRILMADAQHATLHDLKAGKDIWTASFSSTGPGRKPRIDVRADSIWICFGGALVQLDKAAGTVKNTVPIPGELQSFAATPSALLAVSAIDETTRRALRVDPVTGRVDTQDVVVPRSEKHLLPNELPPNVAPTAAVLLSQALEEKKFNRPLDAMSSQFFSAGENLVEFRVKLTEPSVAWVQSIKPKGPSLINGNTTASTSAFGVADEVFNDIKRSQTGGVKAVDQSRYEVKVRRWTGAAAPLEWTAQMTGPPAFFPLDTVDLVAAGKTLNVIDKKNQPLFQAALSYPVSGRFTSKEARLDVDPGVEGPGGLYFFDQGVLTAFSLPGGLVRWRIPTVGVTKLVFDNAGMLYVDSTTATPEDVQYSDQISFNQIKPVLLKVDPSSGKILWQVTGSAQECFVAGKFLYTSSANLAGVQIAEALGNALGEDRSAQGVHFHIYRLEPATGKTLWDYHHEGAPQDLTFQDNNFVLRYDRDVEAWRFLSF